MTTFEHGKAPAWACATWVYAYESTADVVIYAIDGTRIDAHKDDADAICRALSLAKLAEDWGKADMKFRHTVGLLNDMFVENVASQADARKSDAARAALLKACAE